MVSNDLNSLIALLDDPDSEIFKVISEKIITQGISIVPQLEKAWEVSQSEIVQNRLENLIQTIQYKSTENSLLAWVNSETQDLLEGAFLIARFQYPELSLSAIEKEVEKLRRDAWLEINDNLTALEKVKIINHIIFDIHGFGPNVTNFFSPNNQYINLLLETKKGGPIILSIFYAAIAQRLGLPIHCVNLPKNFVLAYKDRFHSTTEISDEKESILFYINPFNRGSVFGLKEIDVFLQQQKIQPKDEFYLPCTNKTAIAQLLFNLIYTYEKQSNTKKVEDLKKLLKLVEE
ncbi:MAG: transglutaminase-like domain-containing protein [Bacteroidales bacterium]